jgi:hypothetical protein
MLRMAGARAGGLHDPVQLDHLRVGVSPYSTGKSPFLLSFKENFGGKG